MLVMAEGPLLTWKTRKRTRMMHAAPSMRMGLATAIFTVRARQRGLTGLGGSWRDLTGETKRPAWASSIDYYGQAPPFPEEPSAGGSKPEGVRAASTSVAFTRSSFTIHLLALPCSLALWLVVWIMGCVATAFDPLSS